MNSSSERSEMFNFLAFSNLLPASSPTNTKLVSLFTVLEIFPPLSLMSSEAPSRVKFFKLPVKTKDFPKKGVLPSPLFLSF